MRRRLLILKVFSWNIVLITCNSFKHTSYYKLSNHFASWVRNHKQCVELYKKKHWNWLFFIKIFLFSLLSGQWTLVAPVSASSASSATSECGLQNTAQHTQAVALPSLLYHRRKYLLILGLRRRKLPFHWIFTTK